MTWSTIGTLTTALQDENWVRDMCCTRPASEVSIVFTQVRIQQDHAHNFPDGDVWSVTLQSSETISLAFIKFVKENNSDLQIKMDEDFVKKDTVILRSKNINQIWQVLILAAICDPSLKDLVLNDIRTQIKPLIQNPPALSPETTQEYRRRLFQRHPQLPLRDTSIESPEDLSAADLAAYIRQARERRKFVEKDPRNLDVLTQTLLRGMGKNYPKKS